MSNIDCNLKDDLNINELRKLISEIDKELILLLKTRFEISQRIGSIKFKNQENILQNDIWEKSSEIRSEIAKSKELNLDFVNKIFDLVHKESIELQQILYKKLKNEIE